MSASRPGRRGCATTLAALAGLVLSGLYLLNLGAGALEFPSDLLPLVGNLDELGASAVFLACLRLLLGARGRAAEPAKRQARLAPPGGPR